MNRQSNQDHRPYLEGWRYGTPSCRRARVVEEPDEHRQYSELDPPARHEQHKQRAAFQDGGQRHERLMSAARRAGCGVGGVHDGAQLVEDERHQDEGRGLPRLLGRAQLHVGPQRFARHRRGRHRPLG